MKDAEPLIDLSAPRHYEQVTPRGRRRRRFAIAGLAAIAAVLAGGVGYAALHRPAAVPVVPAVTPTSAAPVDAARPPDDFRPGALPAAGLDRVKAAPTR
ncbi:hypothetical protein GCM10010172_68770 [Paractinoplanes ferrugineus]|uniref:Uncharacterized protein n=1 Tax=Paractinoplanes ferrugineus TaxID=113564 RepID=A0A919J1K6_9ACTN|nr:hypothetical protein [Actinoplanes ferrugineus]GIE12248.1 hypothetical protein Afe05nite_40880 [Actinoplanes ferrugineus]